MTEAKPPQMTRIQQKNRELIMQGALDVFSANGFRGATIDQIAKSAGLSKPNVLYYFGSKDEIHKALLTAMLDLWLAPMQLINAAGDPLEEVLGYVRAKMRMSRDYPRESRLFAYEILQGAPHLTEILGGGLRDIVDRTVTTLEAWMADDRLAKVEPRHLIFSIWSMTQHYADFEIQVRAVLGTGRDPFAEGEAFLDQMYRKILTP